MNANMYDYVIVGGGSAGCVLARRLSEDSSRRVLLLEAGGPDDRAEIHIPAAFSRLFGTAVDWGYSTEPQRHLASRALYWPRGKVLGGSSAINAMIYIRGNRADYDGWAEGGCSGWGFEDVLPYFKRSEDNARGASSYHGVGGPLPVADLRDPSPLSERFIEAAQEAGLALNDDFNGQSQEGVGLYQVTQRAGRRISAYTAFLKPVVDRENLTIRTHAHATAVCIEKGKATGVWYSHEGEQKRADASSEVILCGGAINTPQLLMLSGIGSADALRTHGIDVVVDQPEVGQNLQDHLIVGLRYRSSETSSLLAAESLKSVAQYLISRRGMLSSNVAEAGAFVSTRDAESVPDLQFHCAPALFEDHGRERPREHGFSLGPTLVRSHSRGHLMLRSDDPTAHPTIDPCYLDDPRDLQTLVEGLKLAREIVAQSSYNKVRGEELTPGKEVGTKEDLEEYVRQTAETLYHPVGTCRMGSDEQSVVDPALRVRGVDQLRVVDASVMPSVPTGNTNAPTLMIAEKAANLILHVEKAVAAQGTS